MVTAISKDDLAEHWFSFMHTLLERMQRTFRVQGVSQKEIAERLDKDAGFISRCLSGRQNMTVRTIHDIARAMGCRLDVQFVPLNSLPKANNQPRRDHIANYKSSAGVGSANPPAPYKAVSLAA